MSLVTTLQGNTTKEGMMKKMQAKKLRKKTEERLENVRSRPQPCACVLGRFGNLS
jgi:hypothetical protein